MVGGVLLLAAMTYLIVTSIASQQEYFITVDELLAEQDKLTGQNARVSGVVIGDTIFFDGSELTFEIAHVPQSGLEIESEGGLAAVLHEAATSPNANRVTITLYDQPMPDLLQHEAQAIITGQLGEDGVFYADELLLKCPTRYEDAVPAQAEH
ncbi:MAG: cytochrome c maturation protein CcmE [Anaerolineae bacterium]